MNIHKQKSGMINQVSSKYEPPEQCTLTFPTPAEALKLGIKLPWTGKVQHVNASELTKELFVALDEYGLTRTEIMHMFKCPTNVFYPLMKQWEIPPAPLGGRNKAAKSGNLEKPAVNFVVTHRPGQTMSQARAEKAIVEAVTDGPGKVLTDEELDAELQRVNAKLDNQNNGIVMVHAEPIGPPIPVAVTPEAQALSASTDCKLDLAYYAKELIDALERQESARQRVSWCVQQISRMGDVG